MITGGMTKCVRALLAAGASPYTREVGLGGPNGPMKTSGLASPLSALSKLLPKGRYRSRATPPGVPGGQHVHGGNANSGYPRRGLNGLSERNGLQAPNEREHRRQQYGWWGWAAARNCVELALKRGRVSASQSESEPLLSSHLHLQPHLHPHHLCH